MLPFLQHTLAQPLQLSGIGLHTGASVLITGRPSPAGSGVVFQRTDLAEGDRRVPARADRVSRTQLGTTLANDAGASVATVEHLLAACAAIGLDNAVFDIDGPEAPILDGSAAPYLAALDEAGLRPQSSPRRYIEITEPIEVAFGERRAALMPCDRFEVAFEIAFDHPAIGRQAIDLAIDGPAFRVELADCRTFGFLRDVEALRAVGLARGGALDNVIVLDEDEVVTPGGLRRPDEFVRHKALDAIGDLFLIGAPLIGRYEGRYAGHAVNNALARRLLASPRSWRYARADQRFARAV